MSWSVPTVSALAAVAALGLSAGAMLTEAVVLVSYWRSLPAEDFLAWFRDNDARLVAFFGPLQVASLVLVVLAAALAARSDRSGGPLLGLAALLTLVALLFYPLYFRAVNASFATAAISPAAVPVALERWAAWHWLRTTIGIAAFVAGLLALRQLRAAG
jgi:hypothetical protein